MKTATTYREAVTAFIEASPWLSPVDMPALVTLTSLADLLDAGDPKPATVAQFGLTYRSLLKTAPQADAGAEDPLEAALRDAAER
ncbi:hypothetical protein [Demequina litorisediminis]|uniref:Uncharacterized protein n=1 Tax=Demequina litorisediminis TaxID=1849022 RepID=A0ABQ6IAA4_9MICO|nr:hypothetical protein [Demequina litorisediminis]GMA34734.1 hypothetical protein GCM10025876_09380 [Demequina litorisediminis]